MASYREGEGLVALDPNPVQFDYHEAIWAPGIRRDIVPKPRKHGFSLWRIALGLHAIHFLPAGRVFRILAHRLETVIFLSTFVRQIQESWWSFFEAIGEDPRYFLRRPTGDTLRGYAFDGGSAIRLDTAAGTGIGQADRNDDAYLTEATEYEDFDRVYQGIVGSQPLAADTRLTIDFNAVDGWMGTEVYNMLKSALKGPEDPDWNGFTVFFRGVDHMPDYYTPEMLASQEQAMGAIDPTGQRYRATYPRVIDDLYQQRERCVHRRSDVDAACDRVGGRYLEDEVGDLPANLEVIFGVDTSPGNPGGDWQTCVALAFWDDLWRELFPALREHMPEDLFAQNVHELALIYPGTVIVERSIGGSGAVIARLRELNTPGLYRHRERDQDGKPRMELGFPTRYETKRQMIVDTDRFLREGLLGLATPELLEECAEVEWYASGGLAKPMEHRRSDLAGAPERAGAHDDLWMALNLCVQGIVRRRTGPLYQQAQD